MTGSKSTPPPAHNLICLAADLLAVAAKNLIDSGCCSPEFAPLRKLKDALDTFESVRLGEALRDDPQIEKAPDTQRGE